MTAGQRAVLQALTDGPKGAAKLAFLIFSDFSRYDATHGRLRRLEDRGLVRRISDPPDTKWEITHAGRSALNLTT